MEKVAFIIGDVFIYWSSIVLALGVAVAVCVFLAFYLHKSGNGIAAALAVPMAIAASVVLGRLTDWYFRPIAYVSLEEAMGDFTHGGYTLMGAFLGSVLIACLLRLLRIHKNLPQMLDCMSLAGAAGIAVGRLACLFNNSNRGMVLESITELPLAYRVVDSVSGAVSYRLATFMLQSIAAAAIFAVLSVFFLIPRKKRKLRDGDTALLFLLIYGASQALLDSPRYDSLFMRSNGFIGFVQVLGAVAVVSVVVVFSVRMVKNRGFSFWHVILWMAVAAMLGGAGYMEYYVQRHGDQAEFAYRNMTLCLGGIVLVGLLIRSLSAVRGGKWLRGHKRAKALVSDQAGK